MFEFIDILFTLLAGVIFTVCMLIIGFPIDEWLVNLILIMVIMLVSGVIYKTYIKKFIFNEADKQNEDILDESTHEGSEIDENNLEDKSKDVANTIKGNSID